MSKAIVLEAIIKNLKRAKEILSTKIDREKVLKDGKQVLYIGQRAMDVAMLNDPSGSILARIRSEQPEASAGLTDAQILSLVSNTLKAHFKNIYPRKAKLRKGQETYVEWKPGSPHLFVVYNSDRQQRQSLTNARGIFKKSKSKGGKLTSSFLSVANTNQARGITPQDTMHFSHLRGPGAKRNEAGRDMIDEGVKSGFSSGLTLYKIKKMGLGDVKQKITRVINMDAEVKLNKWATERAIGFTGDVTLHVGIIETGTANQASGGRSQKALEKVFPYIDEVIEKLAKEVEYLTARFSKSFIDQYDDVLTDAFFDRSIKGAKSSGKVKAKLKFKKASTSSRRSVNYVQPPSGTFKRAVKGESKIDYISLQRQINASLHDTLKYDVMGKGTAKELLNYRTGRFAGKVEVTKITPPVGNMRQHTIDVKYMYNPYMVFAPGGRLHKINREPQRLAGRAIRKIIKDEAITVLSNPKIRGAY